jgi:lipid-A-disaccharide synthase
LTSKALLVVAGEASGDRAAAGVVAHLNDVDAFGMGGEALEREGADLVCDLRRSTALGVGEAGARALAVFRAWRALLKVARRRRPKAALLVNYTEFNARLAPRLRAAGVRVLWYGAPQVWAWRPQRAASLAPRIDLMAVMFPFEEATWRRAGVQTRYVGHPALEIRPLPRDEARTEIGLTPYCASIAILAGSRPHEVRRILPAMLDAYALVRAERASVDARVLVASSLDENTRSWLRAECASKHVGTFDVDPTQGATRILGAFDVALCASGTASLEAALARAVPIVVYRVGAATELAARLLLRSPNVALPNVLLGRRAFPELLQREAEPKRIATALADALDRRSALLAACEKVEAAFGNARTPSATVAGFLAPWLSSPGAQ